MWRSPQHLSAVTTSFALSTMRRRAATGHVSPNTSVVVEVGPYRHRPVAQPHELRALDRRLAERARDAAPGEVLRRAPRQREDAAGGGGDLVVALAGLDVLLVDLGTGRQPVPEHIRQRRAAAAAVGGGMGVEPA